MPVIANFGVLNKALLVQQQRLKDPALVEYIGQKLSWALVKAYSESGLKTSTGTLWNNLRYVGDPERVGAGWAIDVGKGFGTSKDRAPRGTISAFLKQYRGERRSTNRSHREFPLAWWFLSSDEKAALQQAREGGQFGGETMYAVERAPYIWSQDRGNPRVGIVAHGFIDKALNEWRSKVNEYIQEWVSLQK